MARKFAQGGRKDKAKLCLQKKRFQESLLGKAEANLANLHELIDTIEFTQIQQKIFEGLKTGSATLKELQREMTPEAVDDLLLDTQEAIEQQQEVSRMLSEKLTDEDEEDILQELAALSDEKVELPDVPTHPIVPAEAQQPRASRAANGAQKEQREAAS